MSKEGFIGLPPIDRNYPHSPERGIMNCKETLMPANDWFFVALPRGAQNKTIVSRLAAWKVDVEGRVIGLVSVPGGGDSSHMPTVCRLIGVPPLYGVYKHESELTSEEKSVLASGPIEHLSA